MPGAEISTVQSYHLVDAAAEVDVTQRCDATIIDLGRRLGHVEDERRRRALLDENRKLITFALDIAADISRLRLALINRR